MYKTFYDLTSIPFGITSYQKLPVLSANHQEGMVRLLNGITRKKGLIVLTGESGTGKTNLLTSVVRKLDKNTHIAFLANPGSTLVEILRYAFYSWNIEADNDSADCIFIRLSDFLVGCEQKGEPVVLVIDEAQVVSCDTLKKLVTL